MLKLSQYSLVASVVLVALALICYMAVLVAGRSVRAVTAPPQTRLSWAPTPTV